MLKWMLVLLVACGSETEKDYSGNLGQCRLTNTEVSIDLCMDYSYSAKAEKDPGPDAASNLETSCKEQTKQSGKWTASKPCSTDAVYVCDASASAGSAVASLRVYMYGDGATSKNAATLCKAYDNGTLTKL